MWSTETIIIRENFIHITKEEDHNSQKPFFVISRAYEDF